MLLSMTCFTTMPWLEGAGCDNMSAMVVLLKATAPELAAAQKGGSSS